MSDDDRMETLREAVEHLWSALSRLGYTVGLAEGQIHGNEPDAEVFRITMTSARRALNELLPSGGEDHSEA
jgi:hypothetical protein